MRYLLTLISVVLLSVGTASASDLNTINKATLPLYNGSEFTCSSQVVHSEEETFVLTANHCVKVKDNKNYNIRVQTFDEKKLPVGETVYYVDVFKQSDGKDYAVLKLREKDVDLPTVDIATVEEAETNLTFGKNVIVVGYPQGMFAKTISITDGRYAEEVLGYDPTLSKELFSRTAAPVYYGSSGGGLYTETEDGWKLVGITSQLDPSIQSMVSLFVTPKNIEEAIRGAWTGAVAVNETVKEALNNK